MAANRSQIEEREREYGRQQAGIVRDPEQIEPAREIEERRWEEEMAHPEDVYNQDQGVEDDN